jgi:hypothetical protein
LHARSVRRRLLLQQRSASLSEIPTKEGRMTDFLRLIGAVILVCVCAVAMHYIAKFYLVILFSRPDGEAESRGETMNALSEHRKQALGVSILALLGLFIYLWTNTTPANQEQFATILGGMFFFGWLVFVYLVLPIMFFIALLRFIKRRR